MQKYIDAVKESICSICVDSKEDGDCKLSENEVCAVEKHLPDLVKLVNETDIEYYDKYYELLREKICGSCRSGSTGKNCYLRDDANCALDRYFPLIVETIRKVEEKSV